MWKRLDDQLSVSQKHARLSWQALGVWLYILPNADGAGRFSACPDTIRARCLTVRKDVRPLLVEKAIQELSLVGLIHLYRSNGQAYLVLHDHDQWNPNKSKSIRPKWPDPPEGICTCTSVRTYVGPTSVKAEDPDELQTDVEDVPYTKDFLEFWNLYPRKIGKKKAFGAWGAASDRPNIERVKAAVEAAMRSEQWRKEGGQFIPHPTTWINQGRWDDEHEMKGIPKREVGGGGKNGGRFQPARDPADEGIADRLEREATEAMEQNRRDFAASRAKENQP